MSSWKLVLKFAFSIGLLTLALRGVDWTKIFSDLSGISVSALLFLLCFQLLVRGAGSFQTLLVLQVFGVTVRLREIVVVQWISQFYSTFFPGALLTGGAVSVYRLGGSGSQRVAVTYALLYNLLISTAVIFVMGGGVLWWQLAQKHPPLFHLVHLLELFGLAGIIAACLPFFRRWDGLQSRLFQLVRIRIRPPQMVLNRRVIFAFLLLVFFVIGLRIGFYHAIARVLGWNLEIGNWVWISACLQLVSFFPFAVAGLGVRDVSLIWAAGFLGISQDQAVSYSLLVFSMLVLDALFGLILELLGISTRLKIPLKTKT